MESKACLSVGHMSQKSQRLKYISSFCPCHPPQHVHRVQVMFTDTQCQGVLYARNSCFTSYCLKLVGRQASTILLVRTI